MKKDWKAPEMTCLSVEETHGSGQGTWSDGGYVQSWGPNAVAMVSGDTGDIGPYDDLLA